MNDEFLQRAEIGVSDLIDAVLDLEDLLGRSIHQVSVLRGNRLLAEIRAMRAAPGTADVAAPGRPETTERGSMLGSGMGWPSR